LVNARNAFLGQFNRSSHWLIIADSYAARGKTQDAVGLLRSATRAHPDDYALWLGLGNALADHAHSLTPAARLAFDRSRQLAPTSPAPGYFLGLAMLRSGDPEGALAEWREVLAKAPADASWRPRVEDGILLIESARRRG
jgi:cytochrome c-type biogenesis protein CcmH/NrfG